MPKGADDLLDDTKPTPHPQFANAWHYAKAAAKHMRAPRLDWFAAVMLDENHDVFAVRCCVSGTSCPLELDPKGVIVFAEEYQAKGLMTVRYHPHDGNFPSMKGVLRVKALLKEAKRTGIPLYDHIIFNKVGQLFSYRELVWSVHRKAAAAPVFLGAILSLLVAS